MRFNAAFWVRCLAFGWLGVWLNVAGYPFWQTWLIVFPAAVIFGVAQAMEDES